jgi:diguanylate cyclase (GGDEF)-like protein
MVTRWGGDEFVILLRDCRLDTALCVAEKIRLSIDNERFSAARRSASAWEWPNSAPMTTCSPWLARADRALYEAKGSGRNTTSA